MDIQAPKEKVWNVLVDDKLTREWYAVFGEGIYAETDWKIGSKALFLGNDRSGLATRIIENKPCEILSVEYEGIVNKGGIEDYDSDMAKMIKGGHETYRLSAHGAITNLSISGDMSEDMYDSMASSWDKAMLKIKELAETT